jgi:beta-lactamase class A
MMDVKAAAEGRENISKPQDMLTLLEKIYQEKVLNKEMTADFFKMLSTHKDSFIPRDLPDGLQIANKPGETRSGAQRFRNRVPAESSLHHLRDDYVSRPRARRGRGYR